MCRIYRHFYLVNCEAINELMWVVAFGCHFVTRSIRCKLLIIWINYVLHNICDPSMAHHESSNSASPNTRLASPERKRIQLLFDLFHSWDFKRFPRESRCRRTLKPWPNLEPSYKIKTCIAHNFPQLRNQTPSSSERFKTQEVETVISKAKR